MDEAEITLMMATDHHKCLICEKNFSTASNLYRHLKVVHKQEPAVPGTLKCGLCDEDFATMEKHREHLKTRHSMEIEVEHFEFSSEAEFQNWKATEESSTSSKFVKHRGSETRSDGQLSIYFCHRSGKASLLGKRKRSVKTQGSNKIGCHCPAKISLLKVFPNQYKVEYVKSHVGHTTDVERIPLTHHERRAIALELREKVSPREILNDFRISSDEEKVDRKHLLKHQDIKNIQRDFKVTKNGLFLGNDTTSVDEWVKDMAENEENPIRFYKPRGKTDPEFPTLGLDDFFLMFMTQAQRELLMTYGHAVIIDITDNSNMDDFELITIFVVDGKIEGVPCCFTLVNKVNEGTLKFAFEKVRTVVGNLSPSVFMSDEKVEETFMAWKSTFGFTGDHLLCSCYVVQAWERNKTYIKGDESVKEDVFRKLHGLLEETDPEVFQSMLSRVCKELLENEETTAFGTYFSAHYANRPQMWAHCYRSPSGFDKAIQIEAIRNAVKYDSVNGCRVKRFDKTVHSLMTYLYNWYKASIKESNGTVRSRKAKTLQQRHCSSTKLSPESVFPVSDMEWDVISIDKGEPYKVQRSGECSKECPVYCVDCDACVHNFTCTCLDYEKGNMCEHLHLVCRTQVLVTSVIVVEGIDDDQSVDENGNVEEMEYVRIEDGAVLREFHIEPEVVEDGAMVEGLREEALDLESHKEFVTKELQSLIEGCVASCKSVEEIGQCLQYFQQWNESWISARGAEGQQVYVVQTVPEI